MNEHLEQRIQERAYEIWEQEGRSGDSEGHWLRAEQEVRGTPSGQGAQTPATSEDRMIEKLGDFA